MIRLEHLSIKKIPIDEEYWMVRLFIVDRFGNQHEIDLFATGLPGPPTEEQLAMLREHMGIRKPGEVWPEEQAGV